MADSTSAYLSAEDRARVIIDRKLVESGWVVQASKQMNLAGSGSLIGFPTPRASARVIELLD